MKVIIIGAGFGGIAAAIELRNHGFEDFMILESAPEIGGTWYHNSYPGAACDVPSHLYSFSFAQRRDWPKLCPEQPEILTYLRSVADDQRITPHVVTGAKVDSCAWDDAENRWRVHTADGREFVGDAVVLATGQLHQPAWPRIDGRASFAGHSFHSAQWDHDYDLTGKRVAVIGTGASAVQFVPEIADKVASLTVFQRTGNWFLPRRNRPYPKSLRAVFGRVPAVQAARRKFMFGYMESLTAMIRMPATTGRLGQLRSALFMRWQLRDPEVRRKAWPNYTFGCKRILFSSYFLPTLQRDNVELVTEPITRIDRAGPVTEDGRAHEVDCIIYGTGFKTNDFMFPMDVTGIGGRSLAACPPGHHRARLPVDVPHVRAEHEHLRGVDHLLPRGAGPLPAPGPRAHAGARRGGHRGAPRDRGGQ
jgi:cation diffusion facilitator CzcD-associated flavoprotein CzcO